MTLTFRHTGDEFSALRAASAWLDSAGYDYGPVQGSSPIGILRRPCVAIPKWRHIYEDERATLDGTITFDGGPRFGDAIVTIPGLETP